MTVQIDPVILRKLDDFRQRRRRLIIWRGVAAAGATLLLAMMLVAVVDALFILPDAVRWSLSGAAYLAVIVVEWRVCLRLLARPPARRELARMVEATEPELREQLLSAIELSEADHEALGTSTEFRRLLERSVAQRLTHTNMDALLPVQLVRRSLLAAICAFILCLIALVLSGRQFGTLLLRALAPGANLARVSQVQVEVLEPSPADRLVAHGETEAVVVAISGQRVNAARLETISATGRSLQKMSAAGADRFTATIQIGRDDVTYRIYAGDAVTRKFTLRTAARPHVAKFEKTFTFPSYVHREPRTVADENGDLIALEGTEVALRLHPSQPARSGELRLDQGGKTSVVPLVAEGDALTAQVSLRASGTYRVHLVSAATGFENKFSPEYELRPEPDLIPQIELTAPEQDLILPANEIVNLRGTASDDQGLARISQLVRIDDGAWKEIPIVKDAGASATIDRRWDLYEAGVKPGDLLSTKLLAVDLKGGRAESRVLRISVTKSGFESKRLAALESQRALYAKLQELRAAGDEFSKRAKEVRQQFDRLAVGDEQRRQAALTGQSATADFERVATAAWEQLLATLREAEAGHASADLVQLGRVLSRSIVHTQTARGFIDAAFADPLDKTGRDLAREFAETAERAEQRARKAEDSHRVFLAAEEFALVTENLFIIAGETRRLVELSAAATTPGEWASVAGRLRVVLAEVRSIEQIAEAASEKTVSDRLKWLRKEFGEARGKGERALAAGEPGPGLRESVQNLKRIADNAANQALGTVNDLSNRAAHEHLQLVRETPADWTIYDRLRDDLSRLAARKEWPDALRADQSTARWEQSGAILKQHGDLEEIRASADAPFLQDLRTTTLALDSLRMSAAKATPEQMRQQFETLAKDFRLLEAGHSLAEILDGLQILAAAERWEISTTRERTAGPQNWRWLDQRLRFAPEELNRIQATDALRETVQKAQQLVATLPTLPAWPALTREMQERFVPQREPSTAVAHVPPISAQLKQALDLLRQPMDEARQRIATLAPKLSEIMNDLAQKSQELKQKTDEQAQKNAEKSPEQAQAETQQALAQQQKLNERVETLKDALRADANRQDILQQEGRERARDADDALALLKEPPPNAEAALNEAAQAATAEAKTAALEAAAQEQQKLAKALEQLAQHYDQLEQGQGKETRQALRKTEEQTGIREAMEQQFARAEELQKMAEQSPEELLKKLESALPKNPVMQQELSNIARNDLGDAMKKLAAASSTEEQVAQNVQKLAAEQPPTDPNAPAPANNPAPNAPNNPAPNAATPPAPNDPAAANNPSTPKPAMTAANPALAEAMQKQKPIAQAAQEAGEDVARAGRHEQRLNNTPTGTKLEALGEQIQETAKSQVPKAEQALAEAPQAAQAVPAVKAANEQLKQRVADLKATASAPKADTRPAAITPTEAAAAATPTGDKPTGEKPAGEKPAGENSAGAPATAKADEPGKAAPSPTAQTPPTPAAMPPAGATPADSAPLPPLPSQFGQIPTGTATPTEQMWMARTLDALDAAMHAEPGDEAEGQDAAQKPGQPGQQQQAQQGQQNKPGQQGQKGQQPGQQPGQQQMTSAQQAMNNAAKAAAAAARASRSPQQQQNQGDPTNDDGPEQQVSREGAKAQAAGKAYGKLRDAKGKSGEWGKLPKQVAEQLSRGQNENVAGEYRNQVETYYRVIAEKAKKP